MTAYTIQRLFHGLLVIFVLVTSVFVLVRLGGSPADESLPPYASLEQRKALEHTLGLDDSIPVQYLKFLSGVAHADLGDSLIFRQQDAASLYFDRFPATLQLLLVAFSMAVAIGIPVGIFAALKPNGVLDRIVTLFSFGLLSVPYFWVGLLLILVVAVQLGWLPPSGYGTWRHYVLPSVTAAMVPTARIAQVTRSTLIDVLSEDYIRTARAKGLRNSSVVLRHGMHNASVVLLTMLAWEATRLATGGLFIIEVIFAWPGIGFLTVQALQRSDFPLIQVGVIFTGSVIVAANVFVDLLYGVLDPRIRVAS